MFMAILAILFTMILVIGVHEGGHALAACFAKVKISKVSIGFGKPLLSWTSRSNCQWVWALWPFGGYVQLLNTRITPVLPADVFYCFDKKPILERILILIAGSGANLLLAWFAFVFVFFHGFYYQVPCIHSIVPNSIASQAGALAGDQFIRIDNQPVQSYQEVGMGLIEFWGQKEVKIMVRQKAGALRLLFFDLSQVQFSAHQKSLLAGLGIVPDLNATLAFRAYSLHEATHQANASIAQLSQFLFVILKQLLSGIIPFSALIGPIALFSASISSLGQGLIAFLYFIATLSTAVALINLFPIPGLDGGSIVYVLLEKIRGKPVSIAAEVLIHRLFFIVFFLILIQLFLNDLQR